RLPNSILSRQFVTSRMTMRVFILTALAAVAGIAQEPANTLITSQHTPTADAPVFGTQTYFKRVWNMPAPRIQLRAPVHCAYFVKDGKFELSLKDYLDLVL